MSVCTWFSELFCGKKVPVTPAAPEEKPPETFCRTNRYQEWLDALGKDVKGTGADLIEIRCYGSDVIYRGRVGNGFHEDTPGHTVFYNCGTLEPMSIAEIYRLGVESGSYASSEPVEVDDREAYERMSKSKLPAQNDYEVMPRFKNNVKYALRSTRLFHPYRQAWESHKCTAYTPLGMKWARKAELATPWNKHKRIIIGETDYCYIMVNYEYAYCVFEEHDGTANGIMVHWVNKENPTLIRQERYPTWILRPMFESVEELYLYDFTTASVGVLFDPIRVRLLEKDEELGMEGYVALNSGRNKDTYTRARYRIEVDSELLYADTLFNMHTLYKQVTHRLRLENVSDDGRLYVDNFHFMRKDGTEHTADPAGFSSIGAEPFFPGYERVFRSKPNLPHGVEPIASIYTYSGPYIITNQLWAEAPIY
ncbi:hypothetical protein [Pseudomonas phage D6]|nr:hypothetical protein [Pseudomonas phage D6]